MLLLVATAWGAEVQGVSLGPAPVGATCVATITRGAVADLACSGAPSVLVASGVASWKVSAAPDEVALVTVRQTEAGPEITVEAGFTVLAAEALVVREAPVPAGPDGWKGTCLLRLHVGADGQVKGAWSAPQPLAGEGPQPGECPPAAEVIAEKAALGFRFKPPKAPGDVLTTWTVAF